MENVYIEDIIKWTGGKPFNVLRHLPVTKITTDSRAGCAGCVFIALKGKKFDGHDFVSAAAKKKCLAAVVEKKTPENIPQIVVADTLKALGAIAKHYRKRFCCPVIGISGSDGKTTTKEIVSAFLSSKYNVTSNKGNLNNEIGLPLSLLELKNSSGAGVFEMGMNGPGQLEYLADILSPDISVLTSVGSAHIGFFKSRYDLACAKGELLRKTKPSGIAVVNGDTAFNGLFENISKAETVFFGMSRNAGFRGRCLESGKGSFILNVPAWKENFLMRFWNRGFAYPGLASLFIGDRFSVPAKKMREILASFEPMAGRGRILGLNGIKVFDESYNANPDSMKNTLFCFAGQKSKRKIAVLGAMAELGKFSAFYHSLIGRYAGKLKFDMVLTTGENASLISQKAGKRGMYFGSRNKLNEFLAAEVRKGDYILVKGSRINELDKTVEFLQNRYGD